MKRLRPLAPFLPVLLFALASTGPVRAEEAETVLSWKPIPAASLEGLGWPAESAGEYAARLPAKAENVVRPPVWSLSRHSAGLLVRFNTDAEAIHLRYTLRSSRLAMTHMPATGVSGFDLYALDGGEWRWVAVFRPSEGKNPVRQEGRLVEGIPPVKRTYQLYFPLYNGVDELEIGVPEGAAFALVAPRTEPPIVFYGTSITHGACASRPGMTHPAILGRRLDRPVVNLGFSGNGTLDPEMGALLAEIDAAAYVIDCLPNLQPEQVADRATGFVKALSQARPDTPVILVEDRTYANAWIRPALRERHEGSRAALIRAFDSLVSTGIRNLHYLEGESLLGEDGEATTDGSHPNDLGFFRQANAFEPVLRQALATE